MITKKKSTKAILIHIIHKSYLILTQKPFHKPTNISIEYKIAYEVDYDTPKNNCCPLSDQ